ncbi:RRM domain-containing protein [Abeliophyllum distichum]|uniref:RRM domain-containing protein n=1 Tax=Abeliophyllum distichum TaxID=126358 RepID=A0ABD1RD79_9LAMI
MQVSVKFMIVSSANLPTHVHLPRYFHRARVFVELEDSTSLINGTIIEKLAKKMLQCSANRLMALTSPRKIEIKSENLRRSIIINSLKMSYSRRSRYSRSPSPYKHYDRSVSRSLSRSRSRSCDSSDADNPGNNLYVTGLSARVSKRDLEKHFSSEGVVEDVHLVVDPWTRESRGFAFVTMSSLKDADRCIKYLDGSVLEGRVITVEKARRRRGRTPTPGRYLGLRTRGRRRSPGYSSRSRSSQQKQQEIPDLFLEAYHQGIGGLTGEATHEVPHPRRSRSYSRSISPMYARRNHYQSVTPSPRKSSRRSYSHSMSPKPSSISKRNDYRGSHEVSKSSKSASCGSHGSHKRAYSRDSRSSRRHSRSPSGSSSSRSVTPKSSSP